MNNGTSFQSELFDDNDTHVTTLTSPSTPLTTTIDSFSLEGNTNQISTTVTSTIVQSVLSGVTEAITDAVGTVNSSFLGNESSTLQPLSAVNTESAPIIHNGTNSITTGNVLPGGSSEELFLILNTFIFFLPLLSLLIVVPLAACLYDRTPLGPWYDKMCDFLCGTPEEDEHFNEDVNEIDNDLEKGATEGGARRKNSHSCNLKKNKKRKKKLRKVKNSYSFQNPNFTGADVGELDFTYCGNGSGDISYNSSLYGNYFKMTTEVEGEKDDDNDNGNKGTRTRGRNNEENAVLEGMSRVSIAFCSASLESCTQENAEDHL
ncbi:hypothetical protein PCYB_032950 [Plasmodium cynomolgi strain B]|uniref:Uncharacterized protein n=1 Tax=Plasmodium cynomolgi (strain B) TaxID=1120755 RepID=K6UQ29_PLACD|nr:hypothetical protein PCYB_032950 [Plasmodium cynomolgi strain B]GAB64884.1 hypothetical protein PCYB_032950 [Plasmodium cynomolgi strain B]